MTPSWRLLGSGTYVVPQPTATSSKSLQSKDRRRVWRCLLCVEESPEECPIVIGRPDPVLLLRGAMASARQPQRTGVREGARQSPTSGGVALSRVRRREVVPLGMWMSEDTMRVYLASGVIGARRISDTVARASRTPGVASVNSAPGTVECWWPEGWGCHRVCYTPGVATMKSASGTVAGHTPGVATMKSASGTVAGGLGSRSDCASGVVSSHSDTVAGGLGSRSGCASGVVSSHSHPSVVSCASRHLSASSPGALRSHCTSGVAGDALASLKSGGGLARLWDWHPCPCSSTLV